MTTATKPTKARKPRRAGGRVINMATKRSSGSNGHSDQLIAALTAHTAALTAHTAAMNAHTEAVLGLRDRMIPTVEGEFLVDPPGIVTK